MKKLLSILTLFFFLHSCAVHTLKEVPKERASEIEQGKIIVIHQHDFVAVLDKVTLSDGQLIGNLKSYSKSEDAEQLTKELHIYLDQYAMIHMELNEQAIIPFDKIIKVEIYEYNRKNSVKKIFIVAGTVTTVTLAIGIGLLSLLASIVKNS